MSNKEQKVENTQVVHDAESFVKAEGDVVYEESFGPDTVTEGTVEEIKEEQAPVDPFKDAEWFEYADAVIECGKCGKVTEMNHPAFKQVKTGLQLPFLYTVKNDLPGVPRFLSISCSHCDNMMTLKFVESKEKPVETTGYSDVVKEDDMEQILKDVEESLPEDFLEENKDNTPLEEPKEDK